LGSKEHAQQISDVMIGWEQILDREFQSLDIDADGYVSINDLQTVLK
jgi:Ca2+-binding EF-hand superfamily protein